MGPAGARGGGKGETRGYIHLSNYAIEPQCEIFANFTWKITLNENTSFFIIVVTFIIDPRKEALSQYILIKSLCYAKSAIHCNNISASLNYTSIHLTAVERKRE